MTTAMRRGCACVVHTYVLIIIMHLPQELEQHTSNICPCCPICKKSLGNYSDYWKILDNEVAQIPVPEEYQGWTAEIFCNDCSYVTYIIQQNAHVSSVLMLI